MSAQEDQRGWLKHGNRPGDLSKAPRCGARNRKGNPCQCPAMPNGKCRLHGGLSTGPRTPEGIERIRQARTKHGRFSTVALAERRRVRESKRAERLQQQQAWKDYREFKAVLRLGGLW
jgi:hypothetical protein